MLWWWHNTVVKWIHMYNALHVCEQHRECIDQSRVSYTRAVKEMSVNPTGMNHQTKRYKRRMEWCSRIHVYRNLLFSCRNIFSCAKMTFSTIILLDKKLENEKIDTGTKHVIVTHHMNMQIRCQYCLFDIFPLHLTCSLNECVCCIHEFCMYMYIVCVIKHVMSKAISN